VTTQAVDVAITTDALPTAAKGMPKIMDPKKME